MAPGHLRLLWAAQPAVARSLVLWVCPGSGVWCSQGLTLQGSLPEWGFMKESGVSLASSSFSLVLCELPGRQEGDSGKGLSPCCGD